MELRPVDLSLPLDRFLSRLERKAEAAEVLGRHQAANNYRKLRQDIIDEAFHAEPSPEPK